MASSKQQRRHQYAACRSPESATPLCALPAAQRGGARGAARRTHRHISKGDAGLGNFLELGLGAPKVHRAAHAPHRAAAATLPALPALR